MVVPGIPLTLHAGLLSAAPAALVGYIGFTVGVAHSFLTNGNATRAEAHYFEHLNAGLKAHSSAKVWDTAILKMPSPMNHGDGAMPSIQ